MFGLVRLPFSSDVQSHWIDDTQRSECESCLLPFTSVAHRRHHCRDCGGVFCGSCSSTTVAMPHRGFRRRVRCCNQCLPYLKLMETQWRRKATAKKADAANGSPLRVFGAEDVVRQGATLNQVRRKYDRLLLNFNPDNHHDLPPDDPPASRYQRPTSSGAILTSPNHSNRNSARAFTSVRPGSSRAISRLGSTLNTATSGRENLNVVTRKHRSSTLTAAPVKLPTAAAPFQAESFMGLFDVADATFLPSASASAKPSTLSVAGNRGALRDNHRSFSAAPDINFGGAFAATERIRQNILTTFATSLREVKDLPPIVASPGYY